VKQNVPPAVIIAIIVGVVILVASIGFYVWRAPSVTAGPGVATGGPPKGPRDGGGPDAEALRKKAEYNRTHSGAGGSP